MKSVQDLEASISESSRLLELHREVVELEQCLRNLCPTKIRIESSVLDVPGGPAAEQAVISYINEKKADLREAGVRVGPDAVYPGVRFSGGKELGEKAYFLPGSAKAVVSSLRSDSGTWKLENDGTLVMQSTPERNQAYAVKTQIGENGQAYICGMQLTEAQVTHVPADQELLGRVQSLEAQLRSLQSQLMVAQGTEQHWNKPEDLPPVGCELLIKVPAGVNVTMEKSERSGVSTVYTTETERTFKVFRTGHLADRAGDMEYRLPDNSTVVGRFPWTYP